MGDKQLAISEFVGILAAPPLERVIERRWFGKPYVRLGPLYMIVGAWLFQQGGALGYGLKGHPHLLGRLLKGFSGSQDSVDGLRPSAETYLERAKGNERTFYHIFAAPELLSRGVDIDAWPQSKEWDAKVEQEMVSTVITASFAEGAAFGYHFPDTFQECWEQTFRVRSDQEWQGLRSVGMPLSEFQSERRLDQAVAKVAALAIGWAAHTPGLLDASEVEALYSLDQLGS